MKAILIAFALFSPLLFASDESPFDILELPEGASVTLPRPATTLVPLAKYYRVNPTDKNQVFRLSAPAHACGVQISVFDKSSDQVKKATLKAGESMVYRFERLNGVRVFSQAMDSCRKVTKLVLESNRPMEVGL